MRKSISSAIFAFIAAFLGGGGAVADAPGTDPIRDGSNNLIFHCTSGGREHPATTICEGGAVLLDRTPEGEYQCGECYPVTALDSAYGNNGSFNVQGKLYYNGDGGPGETPRRSLAQFCSDWFGGSYDSATRTCSCTGGAGSAPDAVHGRCRPVSADNAPPIPCDNGGEDPHLTSATCTGNQLIETGFSSSACGTCIARASCTQTIYTVGNREFCGPRLQCDRADGITAEKEVCGISNTCVSGYDYFNGDCLAECAADETRDSAGFAEKLVLSEIKWE